MRPPDSLRFRATFAAALLLAGVSAMEAGCRRSTLRASEIPASRPVGDIGRGYFEPRVEAFLVPPTGWRADPPKSSDRHTHLVWISPKGGTAYGVIYIDLPIYAFANELFHNAVFRRFVEQMRADQGEAIVHKHVWDPDRQLIEFDMEGGLYRLEGELSVRGGSAWAVYRGKLREREPPAQDIAVADRARRATKVGRDAGQVRPAARVAQAAPVTRPATRPAVPAG